MRRIMAPIAVFAFAAQALAGDSEHLDALPTAHYDASMRTTLTIDDHIAAALKSLAQNSGKTFKTVVNEVLRNGLTTGEKPVRDQKAFQVASARRGFLPGIDPLKLNQLVDELEVDDLTGRRHGGTG